MATMPPRFEALLDEGLGRYAEFHEWLTGAGLSVDLAPGDQSAVDSLPSPVPELPLRLLASLAHHARTGVLEFHYKLPHSLPGFADWASEHEKELRELAPEAFGSRELWRGWRRPERVSGTGAIPVTWSELGVVAADFAQGRPAGATSTAFVLVRDWAFRLRELKRDGDIELDLDVAVYSLLDRLRAGDDPPLLGEELERREAALLERTGGRFSTVWSIAATLALDAGPLAGLLESRLLRDDVGSAAGDEPQPAPGGYRPATAITSDLATTVDALEYELYADAIARFISDARTSAPLTIGIKAPWGAGKTSLMRMVRQKLDPDDAHRPPRKVKPPSNGDVLHESELPPAEAGNAFRIEPLAESTRRTTVWFNAWKYQSGEQIWAGLAHAIISQVEQRMSVGERERFWASLNFGRFDRGELRRRIYLRFFERLAGWLVAVPLVVIALIFLALIHPLASLLASVGGGVAASLGVAWRWADFKNESAGTANPALVRDPGYAGRLGFLHLVHEDLERVLSLVASDDRPLVVFIDDLDRCSYTTVSQVIEALNAFLAGDFKKCIFVIAMEPDLVAAQIHVAYKDLFERMEERDGARAGDLGWRFLEKMVQLPLALPPPQDAELDRFVGSLVDVGPEAVMALEDDDESVVEARELIQEARGDDDSLAGVEVALEQAKERDPNRERSGPRREVVFQRAARLVYAEQFDERRPEVQALVRRHAGDLNRNPREIKRFLNVFRFYAYVAFWRRAAGIDAPELDGAAKLAMLAVRCPHLLSALGSDGLLAGLEQSADDDGAWETALRKAPERVRAEVENADVREILQREPRVAARSAGFL